jgi:Tfp pilus assembly protein PilW
MYRNNLKFSERGQNLIELIIVMAVAIIVVGSLTFATISSLRNSVFSQNQSQAVKLTQEGLEKVRSIRNRNEIGSVSYIKADSSLANRFSDLFTADLCKNICYLIFNSFGVLVGTTSVGFETNSLPEGFERQIQIQDIGDGSLEKEVTTVVRWSDYSGIHQSIQTTILRKL